MTSMTHALVQLNAAFVEHQGQQGGADEQHLDKFMRNNPPTFKWLHDPKGIQDWMQEVERIFRAMLCTDAQKVRLVHWWDKARQRLEAAGTKITCAVFKENFLGKYYPDDVRARKKVEFLELNKGDMTMAEHAAKFKVLIKFSPYYNVVALLVQKLQRESSLRMGYDQRLISLRMGCM
jgi:hypothetical protein